MPMSSLIEELQRDALDWRIPVTQLLQKCRVVATKLNVKELADWVQMELDGYAGQSAVVPEYRHVSGIPQVFNPYRGYQPLEFGDVKMQKMLSKMPFYHPISEIEHMASQEKNSLHFTFPPETEHVLRQGIQFSLQPSLNINVSQLKRIIEAVRGRILDWSLSLEAAGVIGEGMSFSREEKQKAQAVTYNIGNFIQGDVHQSQVGTEHSTQSNASEHIDLPRLLEVLSVVNRDAQLFGLSEESKKELLAEAQTLEAQAQSPKPKISIIKAGLASMRSIFEGAVGNLAAAGMLHELAKVLK